MNAYVYIYFECLQGYESWNNMIQRLVVVQTRKKKILHE